MGVFYLGVQTEDASPRSRVAAVLLQPVEAGRPAGDPQILAAWEWGEKEVLRYLQGRGLFDRGGAFVPLGPGVRARVRYLAGRLEAVGLRSWGAGELEEFLGAKEVVEVPAPPPAEAGDHYRRGEYRKVLDRLEADRASCLEALSTPTAKTIM